MFRAAYRSSSGALNCICSLRFTYCNKVKDFVYIIHVYSRSPAEIVGLNPTGGGVDVCLL